jgi:hypothetical protein
VSEVEYLDEGFTWGFNASCTGLLYSVVSQTLLQIVARETTRTTDAPPNSFVHRISKRKMSN